MTSSFLSSPPLSPPLSLRLSLRMSVAFLSALLAGQVASAQAPRLARPGDVETDPVRVTAADFYTRLAAGDVASARQLMTASGDGAKAVEAMANSVTALDRMVATLSAKFGASDTLKPWLEAGAAYKRRQAGEARQKLVLIAGDQACLAGTAFADPAIRFRKEGGVWKVVSLVPLGDPEDPYVALNNRLAAAADTVRTRTETGGFYRIEPALQEFARLSDEAMAEFNKSLDTLPDTAVAPATIAQLPTADSLAGLVGKTLDSADITTFVSSLNCPGEVMAAAEGTSLRFPAAGISMDFEPKGQALTGMTLHNQGDGGFARYPGALPAGLLFGARRAVVEQVVGAPVWSLGDEEFAADFPARGLTLTFKGKGPRDGDAELQKMNVAAPRQDAPPALKGLALQLVAAPTDSPVMETPYLAAPPGGAASLRLQTAALANDASVTQIIPNFNPENGSWGVELTFSPEAARALTAATGAAKGRTLAIVAGGRIIATVPLDAPLAERVVINLGNQATPDAARGLAGQLHAAVFTLK